MEAIYKGRTIKGKLAELFVKKGIAEEIYDESPKIKKKAKAKKDTEFV